MKYKFLIISVVLAGILIAGANLYSSRSGTAQIKGGIESGRAQKDRPDPSTDNVRPVSASRDHIMGNPEAPVTIIEYSDTECGFCKQFHSVLHQIVDEYDGQVAWAYRHFPLHQIHPKAIPEAEATECAAELGGNEAFWTFLNRIFEITPSNNGLNLAVLPEIATYSGLNVDAFNACINERRHAQRVADDYNNAVDSGGRATPFTIVVRKDGIKRALAGSLPYESVKIVIDSLLQEN